MDRSRVSQVIIVLLAVLLTCVGAVSAAPSSTTMEGIIAAAGPSIYMEGSHELLDSEGELVARLSGREHDVDLNSFLGQRVKLLGEWRPTVEAGGKIFEVQSLEATLSIP